MKRCLVRLASLVVVVALSFAGTAPGKSRERQNVLLITVESLRPDRLGCYTAGQRTTPAIDALAARGVRFERAYAASASTAPSVASILTGLYPVRHGLRHDLGGRLRNNVPTLAASLADAGYRTGGIVGTAHLSSLRGLDLGFGHYDDQMRGLPKLILGRSKERRADEVVQKGLAFLDGGNKRQPFFLWLDFYDPHYDHEPPKSLQEKFETDPYGGEVANVDSQIGLLLDGLRERKLEAKTLIILVGSHGEGLGDHGETGHGTFLYETTIRVPLIIVPAVSQRRAGAGKSASLRRTKVLGDVVGLVDLAPTILDLMGVMRPSGRDGRSFASRLLDHGSAEEESRLGTPRRYFIEAVQPREAYGWAPLFAVIEGDRKVVQGERLEVFDLRADPAEARPLVPAPSWSAELVAYGQPFLGSLGPGEAERQRILEEAGALALPWQNTPYCVDRQDWPDPRDRLQLNDPLFRARIKFDQGIVGRAAIIADEEVLPEDPGNFTALELVSFLALRNRQEEFLMSNLGLLQCIYPFSGTSYHYYAHYLEGKGENARAQKAFEMFARLQPTDQEPHYDLAAIYAAQGMKDAAFDSLARSLSLGSFDREAISKDPRVRALRDDPRFAQMLDGATSPDEAHR